LFCGVVAAHAVDSAAWWRGGRAYIEVPDGGGVMAPGGAEEELAEIYGAAGDVATDQVGVHSSRARGKRCGGLERNRGSRGETFDLRFDGWEHIDGGAVGDVAVGPGDVLPCWGASGIEKGWLREQDERAIGVTAVAHVVFGGGDFLRRPPR